MAQYCSRYAYPSPSEFVLHISFVNLSIFSLAAWEVEQGQSTLEQRTDLPLDELEELAKKGKAHHARQKSGGSESDPVSEGTCCKLPIPSLKYILTF